MIFFFSLKFSDVKTSRDTSIIGRGRGRDRSRSDVRGRGGANGRGAKNSALVQTSGLFSEGTGESKLRKSQSGKLHKFRIENTYFLILLLLFY